MFEPSALPEDALPSRTNVIQFAKLLYNQQVQERGGQSRGLKFSSKETIDRVSVELLALWNRAGGERFRQPVIFTEKYLKERLKLLLDDSQKYEKGHGTQVFRQRFLEKSHFLFDILSCSGDRCQILTCEESNCRRQNCDMRVHITCSCDDSKKIPASLLHFIW